MQIEIEDDITNLSVRSAALKESPNQSTSITKSFNSSQNMCTMYHNFKAPQNAKFIGKNR